VGVDTAKDLIIGRLRIQEPGPGYCHFPVDYTTDFFNQLTSEHCVTRFTQGIPRRVWMKKSAGRRNEALDIRVYNHAAYEILNPNTKALRARLIPEPVQEETPEAPQPLARRAPRRRGGFATNWR
jgi:phage terminase large subunit GpA-like protein